MKTCCRCKESKLESEFVKDQRTFDGLTGACKACRYGVYHKWYHENPELAKERRDREKETRKAYYNKPENKLRYNLMRIKREFGLEAEAYLNLVEVQNNLCAICNNPETSRRNINLAVDHDHTTGETRGLLCSRCNRGLGLFADNVEILQKAIKYLKIYTNERNDSTAVM